MRNSSLEPKSANKVSLEVRDAVLDASDRIKSGNISEELSKLIRGGTQALNNRLARLNFLKERLQHVQREQ